MVSISPVTKQREIPVSKNSPTIDRHKGTKPADVTSEAVLAFTCKDEF